MNEQEKENFINNSYTNILTDFFYFLRDNSDRYLRSRRYDEAKNTVQELESDNKEIIKIIFDNMFNLVKKIRGKRKIDTKELKIKGKILDEDKKMLYEKYKIGKFDLKIRLKLSKMALFPISNGDKIVFEYILINENNFFIGAKIDNIIITNKSNLFKDLCLKKMIEASKILKKNNLELEKINYFFEKAEKHNDEIVIDCKKIYYHDKDKLLECISKKFLLKNFYFNLYKREFGIFLTYLDGTVYDKLIF